MWSFGEEVYDILSEILRLRERIKPYVLEQMAVAANEGVPPMRPLWFDFPDDRATWSIEDQYLFGPSVLVAPSHELRRPVSARLPARRSQVDRRVDRPVLSRGWVGHRSLHHLFVSPSTCVMTSQLPIL